MDIDNVLVGLGAGIVGGAATRLNDQTRWRRDSRADAYLKLGDAASAVADAGHDLYLFARDHPDATDDPRSQELREEIQQQNRSMRSPYRAVELLGSRSTIEMAFEMQIQCEQIEKMARKDNSGFVKAWDERKMLLVFEFVSQFTDAARVDLGTSERMRAEAAKLLHPVKTYKERKARRLFWQRRQG